MSNQTDKRLQRLLRVDSSKAIQADRVGLEKEGLRLNARGRPATTPHPVALGSALTNSLVTTDFSENMLEFTTPVVRSNEQALSWLLGISHFCYQAMGDELIAPASMPVAYQEQQVPIANYGNSHSGLLRHYYRRGLALRYGKLMQTIAGVHYNFSFSSEFIEAAQSLSPKLSSERAEDHVYFNTIRNYQRYSWLILYLFGASPALDNSFLQNRDELLIRHGRRSLYAPFATSLRMSPVGYSNQDAQIPRVCHNNLDEYLRELGSALTTSHQRYSQLAIKHKDGSYAQLNGNVLQIESEYYSSIRPKAPAVRGKRQFALLKEHGVQYLEVRNIDLNPFAQVGVTIDQLNFLRVFMYFCAIADSPAINTDGCTANCSNEMVISKYGLSQKPQLNDNGLLRQPKIWAEQLIEEMKPIASWLDTDLELVPHQLALGEQLEKISNPEKTPAAQVLSSLLNKPQEYSDFVIEWAVAHRQQILAKPLDIGTYQQEARKSLVQLRALEQQSSGCDFDAYLQAYMDGIGAET